jgi:hypothetical protein
MATSMLVSAVEEVLEDEESMETFIVNGKPVFVKKGLNPKTVLAIYCQQNNLAFPVYSVGEENENDPEWRIFKARFGLEGKSVMGRARTKKAAETNAARKFLNNLFLSGESKSPPARRIFLLNKQLIRIEEWRSSWRGKIKRDKLEKLKLRNRNPKLT